MELTMRCKKTCGWEVRAVFEVDEEILNSFNGVIKNRYVSRKTGEFSAMHPWRHAYAGEGNVEIFIGMTLQKGELYNMTADREINGLNAMMYYLGCDFDVDPMFPWARFRRFPDRGRTEQGKEPESWLHMREVYDRFHMFHQNVCGPENERLGAALKRICSMRSQSLLPFDSDAKRISLLNQIYPERCAAIPEESLRRILKEARLKSLKHSLDANLGATLFAVLLFMCGWGVENDPLYAPLLAELPEGFVSEMEKEQGMLEQMARLSAAWGEH